MSLLKNRAGLAVCAAVLGLPACGQANTVPTNSTSTLSSQASHVSQTQPDDSVVPADTTSILKKLTKDVVIGTTTDPTNGDTGPHSVSVVGLTYGLKKGQLLVCNFADSSGTPGNGTTIDVFNPTPSSSAATFAQSNDIKGCSGTAISSGNQVYGAGMTSGLLTWFDQTGALQNTYGSPIQAPFSTADVYTGKMYASEYIFTSDVKTGSIISTGAEGYGSGFFTQVATGFSVGSASQSGWSTLGPSGLMYYKKKDLLYIVDGANNTIVQFSHASSLLEKNEIVVKPGGKTFKCLHKKTTCGKLIYSGSPLNAPVAGTILPNGNMIVANTAGGASLTNMLVELTPAGKVLDTAVVDSSATPGVYGLAASGTNDSNTVLFFTDTNSNNLQELEQ
jgi:hypothetical protein